MLLSLGWLFSWKIPLITFSVNTTSSSAICFCSCRIKLLSDICQEAKSMTMDLHSWSYCPFSNILQKYLCLKLVYKWLLFELTQTPAVMSSNSYSFWNMALHKKALLVNGTRTSETCSYVNETGSENFVGGMGHSSFGCMLFSFTKYYL